MYELYTDYGKKFTCKVEISGADTANRKAAKFKDVKPKTEKVTVDLIEVLQED